MTSKVVFDSQELACFHEAGHVEAVLNVGARVIKVELYRESPQSSGRTRTHRTEEQRPHIALGGFVAKYRLYKAGRLLKQSGEAPSEAEFIKYVIGNAVDDRISFSGKDCTGPEGRWPPLCSLFAQLMFAGSRMPAAAVQSECSQDSGTPAAARRSCAWVAI
jgi:hypothetical protein